MDKITKFFEKIALVLKPIGFGLVIVAAVLFVSMFILPQILPLGVLFIFALITMWIFGLALVYLLYYPGAAKFLFPDAAETSLVGRKHGHIQVFFSLFILLWFVMLVYFSVRIPHELANHAFEGDRQVAGAPLPAPQGER